MSVMHGSDLGPGHMLPCLEILSLFYAVSPGKFRVRTSIKLRPLPSKSWRNCHFQLSALWRVYFTFCVLKWPQRDPGCCCACSLSGYMKPRKINLCVGVKHSWRDLKNCDNFVTLKQFVWFEIKIKSPLNRSTRRFPPRPGFRLRRVQKCTLHVQY